MSDQVQSIESGQYGYAATQAERNKVLRNTY